GQGILARLRGLPERHDHAVRPDGQAARRLRCRLQDDDRRRRHPAARRFPDAGDGPRRAAHPVPAAVPEGAAAAQSRALLPAREQAPCAPELPARARRPLRQMRGERTMLSVRTATAALLALALTASPAPRPAAAGSKGEIDRDVKTALAKMYDSVPESRNLGGQARAVLVFPSIVKAGFLFGAQYGEGGLVQQGRVSAYYNTVAASYGLQAGVQTF